MRPLAPAVFAAALLALPSLAWAQAQPAPAWARYPGASEVAIRDVAALVRVTPEARTDVAVLITNPGPLPAPELRVSGSRLQIDGRLRRQISSCAVQGEGLRVDTRRHGRLQNEQLTVIELRVPREAVVSAGGAARLRVGPSDTARVRVDGCGDADIEAVREGADVALSGSADVRIYEAGSLRIAIAGAGDAIVGVVRDGLTASIAGAGDLTVAHADGPTSIAVQGAGDVLIRGGRATVLAVAVVGAGDVTHRGVAERLNASVLGAGDVRVAQVEGEVSRRVFGVGEVRVGP